MVTPQEDDPTLCLPPDDRFKDFVCRGRFLKKTSVGPCALCAEILVLLESGAQPDDRRIQTLQGHTQCESCSTHGRTGFIKVTDVDGCKLCQRCVQGAGLKDLATAEKLAALSKATQARLKKQPLFTAVSGQSLADVTNYPHMPPPPPPHPHGLMAPPPAFDAAAILAARAQLQQQHTSMSSGAGFYIFFVPVVLGKTAMTKQLPEVRLKAERDEFVIDLAQRALVSVNNIWCTLPISCGREIDKSEIDLRIKTAALKDGTAAFSVGAFYDEYTNDAMRQIYNLDPTTKPKTKVAKGTIFMELIFGILYDKFKDRVEGRPEKHQLSSSQVSTAKRLQSGGPMPSQVFTRISKLAPGVPSGIFKPISFVFGQIIVNADNGNAHIVWDENTSDTVVSGLISQTMFAKGASKVVYKFNYDSVMYVAKRFTNVGKQGPVSSEDNREAVEDEVKNVAVGRWLRNKFFETADHKGVEVCTSFDFTDIKVIREVDPIHGDNDNESTGEVAAADGAKSFGTVWLVEPLRPSLVTKYSGTMVHPAPKTPLECTLHAFVHYIFQISGSALVYADVQGSPANINGRDGIHLFDPMVHTPEGCNSVGDHGDKGIEEWKKQHVCASICKGLELASVKPTPSESETD